MSDVFDDQKRQIVSGLNLLTQNDYQDIHLATLQVLERTGVFRPSTKADLAASARLCDALTEVSVYSRAVYPLDQPQKLLHLHTAEACFNNTTKPFDFGQAVLDDEIVRMIKHLRQGIEVNPETLSVDIIDEIGPFGEVLSHDTTLSKMRSLSQTHVFDRNNRVDWENNGKPYSYAKALSRAIELLETHQPEPLPDGAAERIRSIVAEAEKQVGVN